MSKKVVIIGGGFGGVFTARYLSKLIRKKGLDLEVELISKRNYFVFHPLLPEVSAGTINAQDAVTPLRLLLNNVKIRLAEVTKVDFNDKAVQLLQGQRSLIQTVHYDDLVISSGQITDLSLFPGFEQHSMSMKDVADAYQLRNHVIRCLEMADVTRFPQIKRRALTFVIAGGGFSGVETTGELVEMIRRTLKFYPNIDASEIRPILIQRGDRLLPEMNLTLSQYAFKALSKRGVDIKLNTGIASATLNCVTSSTGEKIDTMTIVTTIGNGPSPFVKQLGVELNRGKIEVNSHLQAESDLWVLGDTALIPTEDTSSGDVATAPPTAQFAVREARFLAENIVAKHQNKPLKDFHYKPKGMLASLGNYQGVAEVFGFNIKGLPAWLLWRALYIGMLPGFPTRLRVALNWLFDYFLPRTIVQLSETQQLATHYQYYASGDTVLQVGHIAEGFYVLVSGKLIFNAVDEEAGTTFEREILPGDHFGERLLAKECLSNCTLKAVEDSKLLVMRSGDFSRLRKEFTGLNDYFKSLDDSRYSPRMRPLKD